MSMYSELLILSYRETEADGQVSPGELLANLLASRGRCRRDGRSARSGAGTLATELDYDLALLRLCAAMGVDHDPQRFTDPGPERSRLELTLAGAGIDLGALDAELDGHEAP